MSAFFITSSGTEIGKTYVTVELIRQLRSKGQAVEALKPVISGFEEGSDTHQLLAALEREPSPQAIEKMSPWRFLKPLSPDMAAARENREIDFEELVSFCRERIDDTEGRLLIEGVGGVMAPLTQKQTVRDWIKALEIPTLLVVGSYLGSLSHTLTAVEALTAEGIVPSGIIISESEECPVPIEETAETLLRFLPSVPVAMVPRLHQRETGLIPDLLKKLGLSSS